MNSLNQSEARERERQTDRQTERERQTDRQREREKETETDRQTYSLTGYKTSVVIDTATTSILFENDSLLQIIRQSKFKHKNILSWLLYNKTGLQPIPRPAEQILGFYPKGV